MNRPSDQRVSMLIELKDQPGSLEAALHVFTQRHLNLTHIESRPARDGLFDFYVDCEGEPEDPIIEDALRDLRNMANEVVVLDHRTVPWFPIHIAELDQMVTHVLNAGIELTADHPGFNDSDYRERRAHIESLALGDAFGDPFPVVRYTRQETDTWREVYESLDELHDAYACRAYLDAKRAMQEECGMAADAIPQGADVSQFLQRRTGFRLRPVPGLLSSRDFLNGLAFRVFFSTQYIRHHSVPHYTPEPDICHELIGHAPMFADPAFADLSQEIGLASLGASDADIERLARCYWFSVEFGLVREAGELKAFGAGILSSPGEIRHAMSGEATCRPWDPLDAAKQSYPITAYQPLYFVAESLQDSREKMQAFARSLPRPFFARYQPMTQRIWVDRSVDRGSAAGTPYKVDDPRPFGLDVQQVESVAGARRKQACITMGGIQTLVEQEMNHYDVVIVGAGISGVSAAVHLQKHCPNKSFRILEARESVGGTWDLFRYPGIRSDSDMHTLGFSFKPWTEAKAIADGPSILNYVNETVDEFNLRDKIQFSSKVKSASWSTESSTWTLTLEAGEPISCNFIAMCGGYYNYEEPYDPGFTSLSNFKGQVLHPQFWPEDLEYEGKKVVVIGSGATAMTLVPNMADKGAKVTMVQRSPTYVVSRPDQDKIANFLRKWLPDTWAYAITRFKNTTLQGYFYRRTRVAPAWVKKTLLNGVRAQLGDEYTEKHFTPSYNPWDQRLCLIPNADLFKSIQRGDVTVVTDHIDQFVENGVRMQNGETLEADIIVTATGLKLSVLSGVEFVVDDETMDIARTFSYKGMMFSGIPNMTQTFGYINASWTLRADLTSEYICRMLNYMDEQGVTKVVPQLREEDAGMIEKPWIDDFPAGYMMRSMHLFPKQGEGPWRNTQDFAKDKRMVRHAPIEDSALIFSKPASASSQSEEKQQQEKSAA